MAATTDVQVAEEINLAFVQYDDLGEPINIPMALMAISESLVKVSESILPVAIPGKDETGGTVISLTEAVMGMTAGLCQIAGALNGVADAIRDRE